MRTIKKIHQAEYRPIDDLITYSPLPTARLRQIDPFIFLNHHGPQVYAPNNNGLPFGPHPHRGMETVTFILEGDIMHQDSAHHQSVITAGGIQWMTAGSGLIHSEVSSPQFLKDGGDMEILQLWLNLPKRYKMTTPYYKGFQKEEIPTVEMDNGLVNAQVISGKLGNTEGAHQSLTDVHLSTVFFKKNGQITLEIPTNRNIFFYIVRGKLDVNATEIPKLNLVEFNNNSENLTIKALEDSVLILGHAQPFNEPMVAYGPFVMNTEEEIHQAYRDYHAGKFGSFA